MPKTYQSPRIPIWVAGNWPGRAPFRRAARWDGVVPLGPNRGRGARMLPDDVRDMLAYVRTHRNHVDADFEVVIGGESGGTDAAGDQQTVEPYRQAGATWWLEDVSPWAFGWNWQGAWPTGAMEARIRRGPPRLPGDS